MRISYLHKSHPAQARLDRNIKIGLIMTFGSHSIDSLSDLAPPKNKIIIASTATGDSADINESIKSAISGTNNKIVIAGPLPSFLHSCFETQGITDSSHRSDQSIYIKHNVAHCLMVPELINYTDRKAVEYDIDDEWSNSGFGIIKGFDPVYGLAASMSVPSQYSIADCIDLDYHHYALSAHIFIGSNSVLWINRSSMLFDLPENLIFENYINSFDPSGSLPCFPIVVEYPISTRALCTSRLDCDEAIDSATDIFDVYSSFKAPLSLALTSSLLTKDLSTNGLPERCLDRGGSLLLHSHTHPRYWGTFSFEIYKEAKTCLDLVYKYYDYICIGAVSPFHQTSIEAIHVLKGLGLKGLVGGLASLDDPFIYIRPGSCLPDSSFVLLNQQCMLHGDVIKNKQDAKMYAKKIIDYMSLGYSFGYLDHPISDRYNYGWNSLSIQAETHEEILSHLIDSDFLYVSENEAICRGVAKNMAANSIRFSGGEISILNGSEYNLSINFRGHRHSLPAVSEANLIYNKGHRI